MVHGITPRFLFLKTLRQGIAGTTHIFSLVVVVADDPTVSLVKLSNTRADGVPKFFDFTSQVLKIVCRIFPY